MKTEIGEPEMAIQRHEVGAQIQAAMEAILRNGYTDTANVNILRYRGRSSLGFNFRQGVAVGDVYTNDDGSTCEVVALV